MTKEEACERLATLTNGPFSEPMEDSNSPSGWGARQLDNSGGCVGYIWIGYRPTEE